LAQQIYLRSQNVWTWFGYPHLLQFDVLGPHYLRDNSRSWPRALKFVTSVQPESDGILSVCQGLFVSITVGSAAGQLWYVSNKDLITRIIAPRDNNSIFVHLTLRRCHIFQRCVSPTVPDM